MKDNKLKIEWATEVKSDVSQGVIFMVFDKDYLDIHRFGNIGSFEFSVACASLIHACRQELTEEEYELFRKDIENYVPILLEVDKSKNKPKEEEV